MMTIRLWNGGAMKVLDEPIEANVPAPTGICLRSDGDGRLLVIIAGRKVPVRLRQCFPWSEPRRHLSLRDDDDLELALVEDPAELSDASREALELALADA